MRAHQWSATPLGPPEVWPQALKTLVSIMLGSNQPMFVAWGATRTLLYNDPYSEILAHKHPSALGRDFLEVWHEIRTDLVPIVEQAYQGEPVQMDEIELTLHRRGYPEETHFSFFYSPVRDEAGAVAGLFCACTETTRQVLAERRLRESEARFRAVQETSIDGFMMLEAVRDENRQIVDFRWVYANEAAERIVGKPRDWFVGRLLLEEMPANRDEGLFDAYARVVETGKPWTSEFTYQHEGVDVFIRVIAAKVGDGFAVTFADLSESRRAELQVRGNEERLRLAFAAGGLAAWEWDITSGQVTWSDSLLDANGLRQQGFGGTFQDFLQLVHPDDRLEVEAALKRAMTGDADYAAEFRMLKPDGSIRWTSTRGRVVRDESGQAVRMVGYDADVTEQRHAEERLRASEAEARRTATLLELLIETAPDPIWTKDEDGRFVLVNSAAARVIGRSRKELPGLRNRDLLPAERALFYDAEDERILRDGATLDNEEVVHDRTRNEERTFLSAKVALRSPDGTVIGILGLARDITERKQIEARLRESSERIQLALDAGAIVGTWVWDVPGDRFTADERFARSFGLDPELCRIGLPLEQVMTSIHEEDRSRVAGAVAEALGRGGPYRCEYRVRQHDGGFRWIEANGRVELADDGSPVRFPGVLLDIEERRAAEAERDRATALLHTFIEAVPGVVYAKDREGRMLMANHGTTELVGKPPEEYLGRTDAEFLDDKVQAEIVMANDRRIMEAGVSEQIEEEVRRPDGTPAIWLSTKAPLRNEAGEVIGLIGTSIDITDRTRIEAALVESRRKLRRLNETLEQRVAEATAERDRVWRNSRDLLVVVGSDGIFRAISPAWERVLGHTPEEVVGKSYLDFIWPDDTDLTQGGLDDASAGRDLTDFENRYRHKDGGYRWISWHTAVEGDLVYAYGRDVTEEKQRRAELEQVQEALRQSQKLESMGQLTGGVAHDFNNLLTPIIGGLDMLQRRVADERLRRLVDGALQSAERAKTLVQRLLAFARRQPLQPMAVDLPQLLGGMADLVASTSGPRVKVVVDVKEDLPPVKADPNQLEMAILNLAVNARDAMPNGGQLTIAAAEEVLQEGHRSNLPGGRYVRLSISDTGIGMDEATLARAIEPFFSTKGIGKGTGLGLSMVHGLAAQLGGALTIRSKPGMGTSVELRLPVATRTDHQLDRAPDAVPLAAAGTALLVDDEPIVRASTADMLSDLGYAVVETSSAEEALALIEGGLEPDVVLTDHLMPGLTGTDLARLLKARRPAMPVLIISGYAEDEGISLDLPRLTKPFRQSELAESLGALSKLAGFTTSK